MKGYIRGGYWAGRECRVEDDYGDEMKVTVLPDEETTVIDTQHVHLLSSE